MLENFRRYLICQVAAYLIFRYPSPKKVKSFMIAPPPQSSLIKDNISEDDEDSSALSEYWSNRNIDNFSLIPAMHEGGLLF